MCPSSKGSSNPLFARLLALPLAAALVCATLLSPALPLRAEAAAEPSGIADVAVGQYGNLDTERFAVALRDDGTVWAWGGNSYYQLGGAATGDSFMPRQVNLPAPSPIARIAAGGAFATAVDETGTVWTWGTQHESPDFVYMTPQSVSAEDGNPLSNVAQIAAGTSAAYAVTDSGTLYAWGTGSALGLGASVTESVYAAPVFETGVTTDVAAGREFAFAIHDDRLYAWGFPAYNNLVQCVNVCYEPVEIPLPDGVTPINVHASTLSGSVFLETTGGLYAWGSNGEGQLGLGASGTVNSPTAVPLPAGISSIRDIAIGNEHVILLADDGAIWGAGLNISHRLSPSYDNRFLVFTALPHVDNVVHVAAAHAGTMVVKADGTAWAWGENGYATANGYEQAFGLLGTGDSRSYARTAPTPMLSLKDHTHTELPAVSSLIRVSPSGPDRLVIEFEFPQPMLYDTVFIDFYDMGSDQHVLREEVPLGDGHGYVQTASLPNGNYKIQATTYASTTQRLSAPTVFDNGGAGYPIDVQKAAYTVKVIDRTTGEAVPGATLYLYPSFAFGGIGDGEEEYGAERTTNDDGIAVFENLNPGMYELYASGMQTYVEFVELFFLHRDSTRTIGLLPNTEPQQFTFTDTDHVPGSIFGALSWEDPLVGAEEISEYRVYWEDANGQKVDAIIESADVVVPLLKTPAGKESYTEIVVAALPPSAVRATIYKVIEGQEFRTGATHPVWDAPHELPANVWMEDQNPAPDEVRPVIHWEGLEDESVISHYVLLPKHGMEEQLPITFGRVEPDASGTYSIALPDMYLYPEARTLLHVGLEGKEGELASMSVAVPFVDDRSGETGASAPQSSEAVPTPSGSLSDVTWEGDRLSALLQWEAEMDVEYTTIYFYNAAEETIVGSIVRVFNEAHSDFRETEFQYRLRNIPVPEGTTHLALYAGSYDELSSYPELLSIQRPGLTHLIETTTQTAIAPRGDLLELQADPGVHALTFAVPVSEAVLSAVTAVDPSNAASIAFTEQTLSLSNLPAGTSSYHLTTMHAQSQLTQTYTLQIHRGKTAPGQLVNVLMANIVSGTELELHLREPLPSSVFPLIDKIHLVSDAGLHPVASVTAASPSHTLTLRVSESTPLQEAERLSLHLREGAFYDEATETSSLAAIGIPVLRAEVVAGKLAEADADGNGMLNIRDLARTSVDLNGDGAFDIHDIVLLLRRIHPISLD